MYIIEIEQGWYWMGGCVTEDANKATEYTKDGLPKMLGNRILYTIGDDPTKWIYVSTCDQVSRVLKK